ncbi:MAG: Ig-like domain-containing protein [Crenarchaeota archaeon]|nr:Ig-like domain-containing protein [Thermoproteota archaeon]
MSYKGIGLLLLILILVPPIAYANINKIDKELMEDRLTEKLANAILKAIEHEVHISQQNGTTIAYGKIVLKPERTDSGQKILSIKAGSSNRIYIGYEIVPLDRSVSNPTGGWAKVYGYVGVKNGSNFYPLQGVVVEAYDRDGDTTIDFLGSTTTDSSGFFEISFDNTDGLWGLYGNQDVFLKIILDGSFAVIKRSGSTYYAEMEDDKSEVPDNTAVSIYLSDSNNNGQYDIDQENYYVAASSGKAVRYILEENLVVRKVVTDSNGNYYVSNPNPAGAALILWYIQQAARYMQQNLGITPPKITVEFSDAYSSTYYDVNSGILYVSGQSAYSDWLDMSLVLKEYARFLLKQYTTIPIPSPDFSWTAHKTAGVAWVEGFGAFFGSVVKVWSGLSRGYYDRPSWNVDPEAQYDSDGIKNDYDIAGAVAGILWDLYDSVNDDKDSDGIGDQYSIPISWIWNTIDYDNPTDIIDFYNKLRSRYSVNTMYCWEIYWEHGVNLDSTPPTLSITSYSPSLNTWTKTSTISISWTASDDLSGVSYYRVELYKDGSLYSNNTYTSTSVSFTNLPSGKYVAYIYAYDRARNRASTTLSEFRLDTTAPSYSSASPTGTIYDSSSSDIVLTITWTDSHSGVNTVYFSYRYSSESSWRPWQSPSSSSGSTYYYQIPVSEWKQHIGEVLYWRSYAKDNVGNEITVEFSVTLADDDTSGPSISSVTTSGDVYDSASSYSITATVTDPSGVSSVTFYWRFEDSSWNSQTGQYIGNNQYRIQISNTAWQNTPLWQGRTYLRIYFYIVAVDNDNDRPNDTSTSYYGSSSQPQLAGYIYDDDTSPPNVTLSSSTTGNIYDNYSYDYKIAVIVTDASGVAQVKIYWSFDGITWNEVQASSAGDVWYIYIPRSVWSQAPQWQNSDTLTIYYKVWAIDNDNDRIYDQSEISTNPGIAGVITDDDRNPPSISPTTSGMMYDNEIRPFYINATITDQSPLASVIFWWSFDGNNWNQQTPNKVGNLYWIAIDRSVWSQPPIWEGKTYITIYYKIQATDADNDRINDSLTATIGPAEAGRIYDDDPDPPEIVSIATSGTMYDNEDRPFYINATLSDASGIYNVTFYWRFNDLNWIQQAPTGNIGNTYYLAIDKSLWSSTTAWEGNTRVVIYFYIIAYDNDLDRGYADQKSLQSSVIEAGRIEDDDINAPSIQQVVTTGNIYDSYNGPFFINATVIDSSGVYNVTIRWSFDGENWNTWKANKTGDVYWIKIDKSLWSSSSVWAGRTYIVIYYQVIAYDADMDRPRDQLKAETGIGEAGTITDDDTTPPQILSIETSGILYDNYTGSFIIRFKISDSSGLSAVYVYWGFDPTVPNKYNASFDPVSLYWSVTIDRGLWASTNAWSGRTYIVIYYKIEATDADDDRPYDSMTTTTNVDIAGEIHDDDTQPPIIENIITSGIMYDNSTESFVIKVNFSDASGIKNATIYFSFDGQTWYFMDAQKQGTICWIEIPKEIWASTSAWVNAHYITIYFYIKAYDNDVDRGESDILGMQSTIMEAGKIYDDDTNSPEILSIRYTGSQAGYIYDNFGADIYINATIVDASGLDTVIIAWRFNDGDWNYWSANCVGDVYYIVIPYSVWSQSPYWYQGNLTIYYRIIAKDNDRDRPNDQLETDTGVQLGPIIIDDDDDPPMILSVSFTSLVTDDYMGDLYINATITDASGIDRVIIYYRFGNSSEWYYLAASYDYSTGVYYIAISRSIWASTPYWDGRNLVVYYRIVAYDADLDRPNDQLIVESDVHPGPVVTDDDAMGPMIISVYVIDSNNDGVLEADERFRIVVVAYDESGIRSLELVVCVNEYVMYKLLLGSNITREGQDTFISALLGPVPAGELKIRIYALDNDTDRGEFDSAITVEYFKLDVHLENLIIEISPVNAEKNYSDTLVLYIKVYDDDGVFEISSTLMTVTIHNDNGIVVFNTTLELRLCVDVVMQVPVYFSAGEWKISVTVGDDKHFAKTLQETKLYVYQKSSTEIYLKYPKAVQGETIKIVAYLQAEDNSPIANETIVFYIGSGNNWIVIGRAITNASGYATLTWTVDLELGVYVLRAVFEGSRYYYSSSTQCYIEIVESEATIVFLGASESLSVAYSDNLSVVLLLYDWKTEMPIKNETIYLYIRVGSEEIFLGSGVTNSSGYAVIYTKKIYIQPGQYILIAKWLGNSEYSQTKSTKSLIVTKECVSSVQLSISPNVIQYTDTINVVLYVVDDEGEPVVEGIVVVEVLEGNRPIDRFKVKVVNGSAEFSWKVVGTSKAPTTLTIKVTVEENYYYMGGVSSSEKFSVDKEVISIDIKVPDRIFVAEAIEIQITVVDDDGELVDSVDVTIYINDIEYDRDIAVNGKLTIPWVPSREGQFTIRIVAGANSQHYAMIEKEIIVNVTVRSKLSIPQEILYGLLAAIVLGGVAVAMKKRKKSLATEMLSEDTIREAIREGKTAREDTSEIEEEFRRIFEEE